MFVNDSEYNVFIIDVENNEGVLEIRVVIDADKPVGRDVGILSGYYYGPALGDPFGLPIENVVVVLGFSVLSGVYSVKSRSLSRAS